MALPDGYRERVRSQLSAAVHAAFAQFTQHASLVTRTNPHASAHEVLSRPDVNGHLAAGVAQARETTQALVRQAWSAAGGPADSGTLHRLLADTDALYDAAARRMRMAVQDAYESVPHQEFEPGVSEPGTNPAMEAAHERAGAVATAIRAETSRFLVSNRASVAVAASAAQTDATLEQAQRQQDSGQRVLLRWMSKRSPRTCPWCWELHGTTVPAGTEFPHGEPVVHSHGLLRHPPQVWGHLYGPPRHPECECRLEIVVTGEGEPPEELPAARPQHRYIRASDIAAMPDAEYHALLMFMTAAVHELQLVLRRLLGV